VFLDYNLGKDEIEASLSSGFNDIYDTFCRITALRDFRAHQQFSALYEVYKRAKGQIPNNHALPFTTEHLKESAEKELHQVLTQAEAEVNRSIQAHDYSLAYQQLSHLQPPLALLFEKVKILDDNPELQQNRLALLQKVFGLFAKLVDFSKIQMLT
jgi:glycyl-tRNA synthetase